jgi:hypothetical protein
VVYNPDDRNSAVKTIRLGSPDYFGALDLKADKKYYAYEFWDNKLAGEFIGSDSLRLNLRPGEAKILSIREKVDYPQLLSTDRHLMQGMIETKDLHWNPETLQITGKVELVKGEEMNLTFAGNGYVIKNASVEGGTAVVTSDHQDHLNTVKISGDQPGWKTITLTCQKQKNQV